MGAEVAVELVAVDHLLELEVGLVGNIRIRIGREKDMPDMAGFVPLGVEGDDLRSPILQLVGCHELQR